MKPKREINFSKLRVRLASDWTVHRCTDRETGAHFDYMEICEKLLQLRVKEDKENSKKSMQKRFERLMQIAELTGKAELKIKRCRSMHEIVPTERFQIWIKAEFKSDSGSVKSGNSKCAAKEEMPSYVKFVAEWHKKVFQKFTEAGAIELELKKKYKTRNCNEAKRYGYSKTIVPTVQKSRNNANNACRAKTIRDRVPPKTALMTQRKEKSSTKRPPARPKPKQTGYAVAILKKKIIAGKEKERIKKEIRAALKGLVI